MKKIDIFDIMGAAMKQIDNGAFLMAGKENNPMTIGWGLLGVIWGRPMCAVLVRKTRYSHELLKDGHFTLSVPYLSTMKDELSLCGTASGRDMNKLEQLNVSAIPLPTASVGAFPGCQYYFDCKVVYEDDMDMSRVDESVKKEWYNEKNQATADGDPHTIYFAEVTNIYLND
ncbi:MAG: flavin reductase family protein [Clostridia bacterium]